MIIDLADGGAAPPAETDVLLIGAGTCGLLLANAIRHAGWKVTLLESGGLQTTLASASLNEVEQGGERHYRGATEGRMRALGGTSALWGGALLPFQEHDLASRPYLDIPGWPIDHIEIARWIPELEAVFGLPPGPYGANWLTQSVRERAGIADDELFETRYAKWPAFARRNTARLFGRPLRDDADLVVCVNATADTFDIKGPDGRIIRGVVCLGPDGRRHPIAARHTVVCAGAIESTRLLLASSQFELSSTLGTLQWLGRGFHDHLSMHVAELKPTDKTALNRLAGFRFHGSAMRSHRLELTATAQLAQQLPSAWAHIGFESTAPSGFDALRRLMQCLQRGSPPMLQDIRGLATDAPYIARLASWRFLRKQLLWPREARYLVTVVGEQLPRPQNRIGLSTRRNALGQRLPIIEWSIDQQDLETLRQTTRLLGKYWQRHAAPALGPLHWLVSPERPFNADELHLSDIYHPGGTTRMSRTPEDGVVDADLAVHGIRNLSVLSTSVFPTGASANPTMTLLLLTLRLADRLGRELAKQE